jgi:hypothetical protein
MCPDVYAILLPTAALYTQHESLEHVNQISYLTLWQQAVTQLNSYSANSA